MIVPRYWAEGRLQHRDRKSGQITVRRFGWSDASQEEAQTNADQRTHEALARLIAGEKLPGREPKVPYNGADGVPIREEVISRHGEIVITRNSYGARCLNTPDVLFADLDSLTHPPARYFTISFVVVTSILMTWYLRGAPRSHVPDLVWLSGVALINPFLSAFLAIVAHRIDLRFRGGSEGIVRRGMRWFIARSPEANLCLYRTPAGHRILATHRTFNPKDPLVEQFFRTFGADKVYARMCVRQNCFRARVSAKPWRIGITERLRPRGGTWPVAPERLPARAAWVQAYETVASGFAACAFVESTGSGVVDPGVQECMALHDTLCDARSGKPLA